MLLPLIVLDFLFLLCLIHFVDARAVRPTRSLKDSLRVASEHGRTSHTISIPRHIEIVKWAKICAGNFTLFRWVR